MVYCMGYVLSGCSFSNVEVIWTPLLLVFLAYYKKEILVLAADAIGKKVRKRGDNKSETRRR